MHHRKERDRFGYSRGKKWEIFWVLLLLVGGMVSCSQQPVAPDADRAISGPGVLEVAASGYTCEEGVQRSGALYRICMPEEGWNGDLFVFAHGYVAPNKPLELGDDSELVELVTGMGYAYATTTYSKNGLAVKQGVEDVTDLVAVFTARHGEPRYTYLVGGSEGGIITTLAVEKYPDVFDGGMSLCGPVGDFRKQVDYFGDFRVVFDYFFPGVLPGSPIDIPQELMDQFETVYVPRILDAIHSDPDATRQLLRVTNAPYDPSDPATIDETVVSVLWYNVFSTNDAREVLGGQPFDNQGRYYKGSDDDRRLNQMVARFSADPEALAEIERFYQTSGQLQVPLVALHTVADPVVPFWHQPLYRYKVWLAGASQWYSAFPIFRYGHCAFEPEEVLAAFALLVFKVSGEELVGVENVLGTPESRKIYQDFQRELKEAPSRIRREGRPLAKMTY
ncbi:MAG: hypothetical protein GXO78_05180 [Calditrichaeota bacterium]|nr:hypothetical protein [Calditrichota bacterium]